MFIKDRGIGESKLNFKVIPIKIQYPNDREFVLYSACQNKDLCLTQSLGLHELRVIGAVSNDSAVISTQFSGLYLLSFFTILVGLMLYSSTSTYVAQDPRVYKQFRNPSGPVVDLPASSQMEPSVTYTSLGQETEEEPHVRVA